MRHKSKHDNLHQPGHCNCICEQCFFSWTTRNPKTGEKKQVGLCICEDCTCGSPGSAYLRPSVILSTFYGKAA